MSTTENESSDLDMECDDDPSYKVEKGDTWAHEEIVALLSVWKRYVAQLDRATHKKLIYVKMSDKLISQLGVNRDRSAVQEMVNKMKGLYKKNMPSKPNSKSKWRYWRAVDEILGEPDSEEESLDDEDAEEMDSTEEDVEVLPTKKPRGRPSKSSQALPTRGTPLKKRKVIERTPRQPRPKKPAPRDEILEKMLAQDKEYDTMLNKLNSLFEDTTQRVLEMQQKSNQNIIKLGSHLEEYIRGLNDKNLRNNIGPLTSLADNSLLTESPFGVPPSTNTSSQALVPYLRSVINQLTSQRNEQNMMNN